MKINLFSKKNNKLFLALFVFVYLFIPYFCGRRLIHFNGDENHVLIHTIIQWCLGASIIASGYILLVIIPKKIFSKK